MPSAEGAIPEDYAKVAEAREHLGLGEERPRAELGSRLPTPTQHLRAAKVASPAVGCCRWPAFHSCDARSMQRLTHAHGSTLDPPGSSLVWLDKHDGRTAKGEERVEACHESVERSAATVPRGRTNSTHGCVEEAVS